MSSKKVQDFFKGQGITYVVAKTCANQAESAIRTVKKRLLTDFAQIRQSLVEMIEVKICNN